MIQAGVIVFTAATPIGAVAAVAMAEVIVGEAVGEVVLKVGMTGVTVEATIDIGSAAEVVSAAEVEIAAIIGMVEVIEVVTAAIIGVVEVMTRATLEITTKVVSAAEVLSAVSDQTHSTLTICQNICSEKRSTGCSRRMGLCKISIPCRGRAEWVATRCRPSSGTEM